MVARKPLPANAVVDPKYASPSTTLNKDMDGPHDHPPPPAAAILTAKDTATTKQQEPGPDLDADAGAAADSDVDSWERASATASEDEEDDDSPSQSHPHREEQGPQHEPTKHRDAEPHGTDDGEVPSKFPPAVVGGWEDKAIPNTPDSRPSLAGTMGSAETNPFRRKMSLSNGQSGVTVPPMPAETPPLPPSEHLANLTLNANTAYPWEPVMDDHQEPLAPASHPIVSDQEPAQNIWDSRLPSRAASTGPKSSKSHPYVTPGDITCWNENTTHEQSNIAVPASFGKALEGEELEEDSHAWDDVATDVKGKAPMMPSAAQGAPDSTREEEWNLIDNEPTPISGPSGSSGSGQPSQPTIRSDGKLPLLPPRNEEKAPAYSPPPRAPISGKTETYQVKNIDWHDAVATKNPRNSPVLVQNANGPCPLMALVNALSLTTPVSAEDAVLVNTLKTREQISLDLLLDAVFDELMSERRTTPDQSLPDITELYSFLKGLHTGMNVNPRFVPTEETEKAFKRTSLTHLHPTERGDLIPGTFEDTREMSFYRIFQVPLIHGWLPPRDDPVYESLKRRAESYEDAQNILFREEELEDKLAGQGLSGEEQAIFHDIMTIKSFLYTAATQLTPWGLEVITKAMRPGSVAILFRNDHFSTLYRHPQTLQIFTLVTDAGYAGHREVVWESLVDVNGERSEFFSGDFRVVGGPAQTEEYTTAPSRASASNARGEWTTVQNRQGKSKSQPNARPLSPKEQEDRDLALALQLQEEEDQRHRTEQAQRRREAQLSEEFIEQQAVRRGPVGLRQGSNSNGSIQQQPSTAATSAPTGRRTSSSAATRGGRPQQQVRPLVPPVLRSQGVNRSADAENVDDAPPSYEDAAKDRPYVPPAGHPSHPDSTPGTPASSSAQRLPLPASRAPGVGGGPPLPSQQQYRPGLGGAPPMSGAGFRRGSSAYRQGVPAASGGGGRDKDCVVM